MSHTQLLAQDEARQSILRGVHALADSVGGTLGPKPNSVVINEAATVENTAMVQPANW